MMAAASPILINTSSPQSVRLPSITPPSLQQSSKKASSASPQLPSPSTFVKPGAAGLKSGSRVQNAPEGVKVGSASAGSLWREKKFEVGQYGYGKNELGASELETEALLTNADEKLKEGTGKLVKPKKKAKKKELSEIPKSPVLKDFEHRETATARRFNVAPEVRPNVYDVPTEHATRNLPWARKASLSLSEYAFGEANERAEACTIVEPPKQAKKPRKKEAKPAESNGNPVVKKPRKRKAKSEAIILNSDEPDPDGDPFSAQFPSNGKKATDNVQPANAGSKRKTTSKSETKKANLPSPQQDEGLPKAANTSDNGTKICGHNEAAGKSIYFAKPVVPVAGPPESAPVSSLVQSPTAAKQPNATVWSAADTQSMEAASRRRRSWTPANNTEVVTVSLSRPPTADSGISDASYAPPLQLTDILGKFGYTSAEAAQTAPGQRTSTGEAITKRRRIELADAATLGVAARKVPESIAPKQAKRAKEPKKKAQTITALVTAAFQPPKEIETNEGIVSAFFSPQKDAVAGAETQAAKQPDPQPKTGKPKKPRKPRAKSSTAAGTTDQTGAPVKPKKTRVSRKKKTVKPNEADERPKLYSPARATAQLKKQDFLFGTSSQLAPAESPEFIRHMQAAARESEDIRYGSGYQEDFPSQASPSSAAVVSPREKSCARVPTAPHGTCLSIEQAGRALWCRAARDFEGGLLRIEKRSGTVTEVEDEKMLDDAGDVTEIRLSRDVNLQPEVVAEASVVDLCTSSLAPLEGTQKADPASEQAYLQRDAYASNQAPIGQPPKLDKDEEDSWMILRSDDSNPVLPRSESGLPPAAQPNKQSASPASPKLPTAVKFLSPRMFRPVLYPLDSNASIASSTSPEKAGSFNQIRTLSSTVPDPSRNTKRPRGRPRKDANPVTGSVASPKKRGRPAKIPVAASSPSHTKSKKTKPGISASQPAPQSEWLDIDEISDSDAPTTPSPPRRRATSSPPEVRPLLLSPSSSQAVKGKAPVVSGGPIMKPDGPQWPSMRAALFPVITDTVKSVPRSIDPANPSWWEKFLLFDPIMVEDLTAWLSEQGLRVEARKQKTTKARKRKISAEQGESTVDLEWEIHEEPLQPWMVQKWCEEKSVCCYTRDGWRGRRGT